jgi:hypothetical protein
MAGLQEAALFSACGKGVIFLIFIEELVKNKEFFYAITIALLFAIVFILLGTLIGATNLKNMFVDVKWTDIVSSFGAMVGGVATVFAALFAWAALKSWKQQIHVQRQIKFLDDMSEAFNEYSNLIAAPIELIRYSKIAVEGYSFSDMDNTSFAESGLVKYIEKSGYDDADTINHHLSNCVGSLNKIRALTIKGNLMDFEAYQDCYSACDRISKTYPAVQAFSTIVGSKHLNWHNPKVEEQVRKVFSMDPEDLVRTVKNCNNEFIIFAKKKYKLALK